MNIKVRENTGIISTGNNAKNTIFNDNPGIEYEVNWEKLRAEVEKLKASSDSAVKEFAGEAEPAIEKKDSSKVKAWLAKWIPCIGRFIETSYYILEISARLGIM